MTRVIQAMLCSLTHIDIRSEKFNILATLNIEKKYSFKDSVV